MSGDKKQNKGADKETVTKALNFLFMPGDAFEVCVMSPAISKSPAWGMQWAGGKKAIISGWFNDIDAAVDIIVEAGKVRPTATYVTLNPVNPALLARANNRISPGVNRTQDKDVDEIRHILIDADPIRPAGISSTDQEKENALVLLRTVYSDLKAQGWPDPLVGDSGNGGHLIYPVDVDCAGQVPELLKALDRKYSTDSTNIDTTVGNPARLVKVYGTWTRKGDSIEDRPHRMAKILSFPGEVD